MKTMLCFLIILLPLVSLSQTTIRDKYGRKIGEIRNEKYYDKSGKVTLQFKENVIRTNSGAKVGSIDNGTFRDDKGRKTGSIDQKGTLRDQYGRKTGSIDKSGITRDQHGRKTGSINNETHKEKVGYIKNLPKGGGK